MNLKLLLPFQTFVQQDNVLRMVVETRQGSYGLLRHRLDFVAALAPGILTYETVNDGEVYVAIDEGVIVKAGTEVLVSVHRAVAGKDLGQLRNLVEQEFLNLNAQEQDIRSVMTKLETGFIRRFAGLQHE